MKQKALNGVKVLDLTHHIAGPYCTKLMADYGAEVIKIERPGLGDGARQMGPFYKNDPHPEKSGFFLYLNTNKKGITLNLKSPTGINIFKDLVKEVDIVVENFRPGVMARLGIGYDSLSEINPALVMTSISNFGQSGPYRDFNSTEIVADAMGGWMHVVGHPDREPLKPGGSQAQFVGGLFGSIGTMTAFHCQATTGIGQHVDISLMEAVLYIQMNITSAYSYFKHIITRAGNFVWPPPGTILPCKNGYIGVIAVTDSQWKELCKWMGKSELIVDPLFLTAADRSENYEMLEFHLLDWLADHNKEDLFREAQKRRLPFGIPVNSEKLLQSDHLRERGYFREVDHPATGKITYPGPQVKMGDLHYELKRAPLLGEHNHEIYGDRLGVTQSDLVKLRESGTI